MLLESGFLEVFNLVVGTGLLRKDTMSRMKMVRPEFPKAFAGPLMRGEVLERIESISTGTVLLCSMAGYGKSTLLDQLGRRNGAEALCILGLTDNNLNLFLKHLKAAVHQSLPQLKALNEGTGLRMLLDICQVALENRMTLIFDNCQVIQDEKVCDALQLLMSSSENGFKVVLASREIPGFAAKSILENRCELLRRDDLAWSENEVGQAVKMHMNREDDQVARHLHSLTGGWAVAVMHFLREQAGDGFIDMGLIKKYIIHEVLSALPSGVAHFAKQAALFNRFNVDICDTVLEMGHSGDSINFLVENEIFLRKCPEEPGTFAWIDIFRKVLLDLLTTKEKNLIAEKAIEYYLKRKMHLKAVNFALEFGQPALICRALSACGRCLLNEGQVELLGRCANLLANSSEQPDPLIHGLLGQYYYVVGDYAQMDYHFNMADSMFGKENIYSVQRTLYRGLLRFASDPRKYQKLVNNALFYLDEYNFKLPFLLPEETRVLEEIRLNNSPEQEASDRKPLKVQQFGVFKIIVIEDGYEISWRTRKSAELLSYLIGLKGKAVDRNQLFDIIWPEELPNNPVAMLHNMIYNIRKELSAYNLEKFIQYKNKGYSIDMSLVDCEEETESHIGKAISGKDIDTLLEYERVLYAYWGEYLQNINGMWVIEQREYYDKMFVTGSLLLADFYYENRIYEKALVFLQNALKVDTFSERVMGKILDCYSNLGRFNKLRVKYDEFCATLDNELGVSPSAELKLAYQRGMQRGI